MLRAYLWKQYGQANFEYFEIVAITKMAFGK